MTVLEIPQGIVDDIGVEVTMTRGKAPDSASAGIHRNIQCLGGSTLVELVRRLSIDPKYKWFSTDDVRKLLAERVGVGVTLEQLKPRVVDDLMRSGLVSPSEAHDALGAQIKKDPCVVAKLKLDTVTTLVKAGTVAREEAELLHPGFRNAQEREAAR